MARPAGDFPLYDLARSSTTAVHGQRLAWVRRPCDLRRRARSDAPYLYPGWTGLNSLEHVLEQHVAMGGFYGKDRKVRGRKV